MKKFLFILILVPAIGLSQSHTVYKEDTVACKMLVTDSSCGIAYCKKGYKVYTLGRWQPYAKWYYIDDKKRRIDKPVVVWEDIEL